MKLSIWQQFSSNNSSDFTVVGEFASHAEAERAAEQIRAILKRLTDWHAAHAAEMDDWWSSGDWVDELSPIEEEIADEYNLDWHGAVEWFHSAKVEIVLDRLVFITPGYRPDSDGKPFDQLMDRLGGKGYHEGDEYGTTTGEIIFDLNCIAPDEETAIDLRNQYLGLESRIHRDGRRLHFDRRRFDQSPPMPELIAELAAHGCTDFSYSFAQVDLNNTEGMYSADDVDMLLEILRTSDSTFDQSDVAAKLGEIGDPRAVEALIEALDSRDDWLRRAAASALAAIADPRAVEPLIRLLDDSVTWTRQVAVATLGRFADSRIIEPLIGMLRDDQVWQQAVPQLGKLGALARDPLYAALENADSERQRDRIERALQLVEDTVGVGSLLDGMRSSEASKREEAWAQVKASADLDTMLMYLKNPVNYSLYPDVIATLADYPEPRVIQALAGAVRSSVAYWVDALNALQRIGTPAVDALIALTQDKQIPPYFQSNIVRVLGAIGDPRAVDALLAALDTPSNIDRHIAAAALGNIGDPRAIQPLVNAFMRSFEHWHPEIGRGIFHAIQQVNGLTALVDPLIAYLPEAGYLRGSVAQYLGEIGDPRAVAPLQALLATADARTQLIIHETLQTLGHGDL